MWVVVYGVAVPACRKLVLYYYAILPRMPRENTVVGYLCEFCGTCFRTTGDDECGHRHFAVTCAKTFVWRTLDATNGLPKCCLNVSVHVVNSLYMHIFI